MGQRVPLSGASFTSGILIQDDPLLTAGSLALFDMTHSLGTPGAGVPASGTTIPNIAYAQAAKILGTGTQGTLAFPWTNGLGAAEALFERTTKGALHGIMSQVNHAGNDARVSLPDLIKSYMLANPTHTFYVSTWSKVTRVAITGGSIRDPEVLIANGATGVTPYSNFLHELSALYSNTKTPVGSYYSPVNTLGMTRRSLAGGAWTGTVPSLANMIAAASWGMNNYYYNTTSGSQNKYKSYVLYRFHVIDLTVLGSTYAAVDAADAALYASIFAVGGRLYGDTVPTSPSALA